MTARGRDVATLRDGVLAGDRGALARAITLVESGAFGARDLLRELKGRGADAYVIGLTGPPGVGKSTLAHRLALALAGERRVGILAVDPTSPFTGGAILGDRIRMPEIERTDRVYIRSMASRGHPGGLARAASDAVRLMAAAGCDPVIVETVGAGQGEVDIMRLADTTLVLLVPGLGDDIQAQKAGILEIGDVFCVNKADLGGADRVARQLEMMLDLKPDDGYRPPVISVSARDGEGISELCAGIAAHRQHLASSGEDRSRRMKAAASELRAALAYRLLSRAMSQDGMAEAWEEAVRRLAARESDPYTEVETLLGNSAE